MTEFYNKFLSILREELIKNTESDVNHSLSSLNEYITRNYFHLQSLSLNQVSKIDQIVNK